MIELPLPKTVYTDQTGRFSCQSSRGNNYMLVYYNDDANTILVKAIKNRETDSIISAWNNIHKRLTKNSHEIVKYIQDNECSAQFKSTLKEARIL